MLAAGAITCAVVLSACGSSESRAVAELRPGDCFDDSEVFDDAATSVRLTPCDQPHDNEILWLLPASDEGGSPQERCNRDVLDVGDPVEFFAITGVEVDGVDSVACVVFRSDFQPLTEGLVEKGVARPGGGAE